MNYTGSTKFTEEQVNDLPDWARKLLVNAEKARETAFYYRQKAVSVIAAAHKVLGNDAEGFRIYDLIISEASEIAKKQALIDDKAEKKMRKRAEQTVARMYSNWMKKEAK